MTTDFVCPRCGVKRALKDARRRGSKTILCQRCGTIVANRRRRLTFIVDGETVDDQLTEVAAKFGEVSN